ncbi:hypothetical protein C8R47DRAFT_1229195 [Mycena vitilis]|nr:hypothetical protein C8R47DRAFT_1229195 [Mycena vitilis]
MNDDYSAPLYTTSLWGTNDDYSTPLYTTSLLKGATPASPILNCDASKQDKRPHKRRTPYTLPSQADSILHNTEGRLSDMRTRTIHTLPPKSATASTETLHGHAMTIAEPARPDSPAPYWENDVTTVFSIPAPPFLRPMEDESVDAMLGYKAAPLHQTNHNAFLYAPPSMYRFINPARPITPSKVPFRAPEAHHLRGHIERICLPQGPEPGETYRYQLTTSLPQILKGREVLALTGELPGHWTVGEKLCSNRRYAMIRVKEEHQRLDTFIAVPNFFVDMLTAPDYVRQAYGAVLKDFDQEPTNGDMSN